MTLEPGEILGGRIRHHHETVRNLEAGLLQSGAVESLGTRTIRLIRRESIKRRNR